MAAKGMKDVQNEKDVRAIPIRKVGLRGLSSPITLLDREKGRQSTIATVDLFADLPHDFKGTHMSRFVEVFDAHRENLSMQGFLGMLDDVRKALRADDAYARLDFPYFIEKTAPVSGQKSLMRYEAGYSGKVTKDERVFYVTVKAPVTTVCPCSRAISDRGAHNQRGVVSVTVELGPFFWIEDMVAIIEESASSGLYSLLKREDEKYVTERAYDNPRFVEDLVREVYLRVAAMGREESETGFPWFRVEAENFESIHNHSAYACAVFGDPARGDGRGGM